MKIQKSLFDDHVGEVFHLQDNGDSSISLTLTKVESPEERIQQRSVELDIREPFSLLFSGPAEPFLEQRMYPLQHEELGLVEVFLVPVGQHQGGYHYEAVFN